MTGAVCRLAPAPLLAGIPGGGSALAGEPGEVAVLSVLVRLAEERR